MLVELLKQWGAILAAILLISVMAIAYVVSSDGGRSAPDIGAAQRMLQQMRAQTADLADAPDLPHMIAVVSEVKLLSDACGVQMTTVEGEPSQMLPRGSIGYATNVPRWRVIMAADDVTHGIACVREIWANHPVLLESIELGSDAKARFLLSIFGKRTG